MNLSSILFFSALIASQCIYAFKSTLPVRTLATPSFLRYTIIPGIDEQEVEVDPWDVGGKNKLNPRSNSQPQTQVQPQNYDQYYAQSYNQNYAQGHTQNYAQGHPQNYAQGHPQNYAQGHPQNYAQDYAQSYAQNYEQNSLENTIQNSIPNYGQNKPQTYAHGPGDLSGYSDDYDEREVNEYFNVDAYNHAAGQIMPGYHLSALCSDD